MTEREPQRAPSHWPIPMMMPITGETFPDRVNTTSEAKLLEKFISLVCAVALTRFMPNNSTNPIAQNVPVPGPRNPS